MASVSKRRLLQFRRTSDMTARARRSMFKQNGLAFYSCPADNPKRFIAQESWNRKPSPIRELMPLLKIPGMLSLGAGYPNPHCFPIEGFKFTLKGGREVELANEEVNQALQYSLSGGLPKLVEWWRAFQETEHSPPRDDWGVIFGGGSQDLIWRVFEMVLKPGDAVFLECPCYSGTLAYLKPKPDITLEGIPTDKDGMIPEKLEERLRASKATPKVLYVIPTGQNPSGVTLSHERKMQIYEIAQKWDMLILEDEPYSFVHYGTEPAGDRVNFTRQNTSSFFSMDVDGRVIRFDSFSKILSSGMRLGTVTANAFFLDRINLSLQATCLHTSGVSQVFLLKLLQEWGMDGLKKHLDDVCYLYACKRDEMQELSEKHLKGLAKWDPPVAGMFFWYSLLNFDDDTTDLIKKKARDAKVLLLPGAVFNPNDTPDPEISRCVRASFSILPKDQMEEAIKRFANLLM